MNEETAYTLKHPSARPEFTFTNDEIQSLGNETPAARHLRDSLQREMVTRMTNTCASRGDCFYEPSTGRIIYRDGWWFKIDVDGQGVIEVQSKPATLVEFEAIQNRMQTDIFDLAATLSLPLRPYPTIGGGHINIGWESTFESDALLFRNFMVDQANHVELTEGALGFFRPRWSDDPTGWAPHIGQFNTQDITLREIIREALNFRDLHPNRRYLAIRRFGSVIRNFDQTHRRNRTATAEQLADEIENQVYRAIRSRGARGNIRAVALHIKNVRGPLRRVELRYPNAQRTAAEWVRHIRLLQARLEYLQRLNRPIAYEHSRIGAPLEERVQRYHRFITETGLPWEDYLADLPAEWREITDPLSHEGTGSASANAIAPICRKPERIQGFLLRVRTLIQMLQNSRN